MRSSEIRAAFGGAGRRNSQLVCGEDFALEVWNIRYIRHRERPRGTLTGEIAKALFAKAKELLAKDPKIHKIEVLAAKGGITGRSKTAQGHRFAGRCARSPGEASFNKVEMFGAKQEAEEKSLDTNRKLNLP